jgi:chromosome segregation ATPase
MTLRKAGVKVLTQDLEMALETLREEIEEMMQDREEQEILQERNLELETISRDQRERIQELETEGLLMIQEVEKEEDQMRKEIQSLKEANKAVQDQNKALREENLRLGEIHRRQRAGIQVIRAREESKDERLSTLEDRLKVAMSLIKEQREMLEALLGLGTVEIPQY